MKPLIEITTVPIQIEMRTTHARLEYVRGTAEVEISKDKGGGLQIKSRPIRVNIDTFEASNSITPTLARSLEQSAQKGQQAAYKATATFAQQGNLMMQTKLGEEVITKFSKDSLTEGVKDIGLQFLPSTGPEINWDAGEMNIRYEMDKLNFDWKINGGSFEFTPGDIEITVTQRPEVHIKYVGGPVYVPPSSDPNYEPVDVKA
ncbi:MAG: hypothetical protein HDT14_08525 [Oscillibacter sp.]|nr:hypothetical protein [Oscillibacter sp.]